MTTHLQIDDLTFELTRSRRRKTVGITVDRGGELKLAVPHDTPDDVIAAVVREKRFWIYGKLAEKAAQGRERPPREYVSGEGFHYLGRSHRLLLVDHQEQPLLLKNGRFLMRRDLADQGRRLFIRWYTRRGRGWIANRVGRFAARMGASPSGVDVRDLGFRWGSCGKSGNLNFHWATVLLPPRIVEYVVAHELAHLEEPTHTPEFWHRVERAMPDYAERKSWLADHGAEYVAAERLGAGPRVL